MAVLFRNGTEISRSYSRLVSLLAILSLSTVLEVSSDAAGDQAALKDFIHAADPAHISIKWDTGDSNHCNWYGVDQCDQNGRVLALDLEDSGLNGTILLDFFSRLDNLRRVNLQRNDLTGIIPDLSGAKNLNTLLLGNNQLSGPIPTSIGMLSNLTTVSLRNNQLNGSIPDSTNYTALQLFDVSNNNLTGSIPASLSRFSASYFDGNKYLCGGQIESECPTHHSGLNIHTAIRIVVGIVVVACVLLMGLLLYFKWKKDQDLKAKSSMSNEDLLHGGEEDRKEKKPASSAADAEADGMDQLVFFDGAQREFGLEDLLRASAEILGKGCLGTTYKALMQNGVAILVKRLIMTKSWSHSEFSKQMGAIAKIEHPNILPLRGYYNAKEEKLLIYDYHQKRSVFDALHSRGQQQPVLDWISRIVIARGVASCLHCIHTQSNNTLLHGNIKSTNIIYGSDENEPLVTDVGLAQLVSNTPAEAFLSGGRAPEFAANGRRLSQSTDIYSYGILLLELLTGKMPMQYSSTGGGQGVDLVKWVNLVVREEWTAEVFDKEPELNKIEEEELVILLKIAMACVAPKEEQRPTMAQVVRIIAEEMRSLNEEQNGDSYEDSSRTGKDFSFQGRITGRFDERIIFSR